MLETEALSSVDSADISPPQEASTSTAYRAVFEGHGDDELSRQQTRHHKFCRDPVYSVLFAANIGAILYFGIVHGSKVLKGRVVDEDLEYIHKALPRVLGCLGK